MLPDCDKNGARKWAFAARWISAAGADDLDVQIADLLAQRVAIDPEQVGGPNLVPTSRRQRGGQERLLDFAQDAVIEARRRQGVAKVRKVARQVPLHGSRDRVLAASFRVRRRDC